MDGGEVRKDLVEDLELQRKSFREQVVEPEPEEALFHARVFQEVLRDRHDVDLAIEPSRLCSGFLL